MAKKKNKETEDVHISQMDRFGRLSILDRRGDDVDAVGSDEAGSKDSPEVATVIGYGTFISRHLYEEYDGVRVVTVKGFRRVFSTKITEQFPFAVPDEGISFKAVAFDVDPMDLRHMDVYESCGEDPVSPKHALYFRTKVDAVEKDGRTLKAWMYIAGDDSYEQIKKMRGLDLSPSVDKKDGWLSELGLDEEVRDAFPELFV